MRKILFACLALLIISCHKDDKSPAPVAQFTIQTSDGVAPDEVHFSNQSKNAEDFIWFFGDGEASMDASPTHLYKKGGTFTVFLKVFGPGGKDSIQKKLTLDQPATLYRIVNEIPVTLDNVRSFYLDWDNLLIYDIIDHGSMAYQEISEEIPTVHPSIEVLFHLDTIYGQLAYPDPIVKDQLNTITIYDTSSFYSFDSDPISSSSMIRDDNRKPLQIKDVIK